MLGSRDRRAGLVPTLIALASRGIDWRWPCFFNWSAGSSLVLLPLRSFGRREASRSSRFAFEAERPGSFEGQLRPHFWTMSETSAEDIRLAGEPFGALREAAASRWSFQTEFLPRAGSSFGISGVRPVGQAGWVETSGRAFWDRRDRLAVGLLCGLNLRVGTG
jgi:hypothetical protein